MRELTFTKTLQRIPCTFEFQAFAAVVLSVAGPNTGNRSHFKGILFESLVFCPVYKILQCDGISMLFKIKSKERNLKT